MPWTKVDGSQVSDCNDGQIAVVKETDDGEPDLSEVEGCHDTEDEANDQIAALEASEEDRMEKRVGKPTFDDTEEKEPEWVDEGRWGSANLEDHPEADADQQWDDLTNEERASIAARYIDGDTEADTYAGNRYLVVNPATGNLNRWGVLAARQRAAAEGDNRVKGVADDLWQEHFAEGEENSLGREVAGVETTPPEAVQNAAQRGLEMVEEGMGGDGLQESTIESAREMARGEALSRDKIMKGSAFWGRNANFCNEDASDAQRTSANLWGGCSSGPDWFQRKADQIQDAEKSTEMDTRAPSDVGFPELSEFLASHIEGASAQDVVALLNESGEYVGEVDMRELATLVGQVVDMSTGDVLEALENMMQRDSNALATRSPDGMHRAVGTAHVRENDGKDTITFEINNDELDRHGTRVDPEGARLENFKANPVVLYGHGFGPNGDVPIGRAENVFTRGNKLFAEVRFDSEDDFAQKIEHKVRGGFLNGASIGFDPNERKMEERDDGSEIPVITDWELLEFSVVSVPSNPDALVESRNKWVDEIASRTADRLKDEISNEIDAEHIASELEEAAIDARDGLKKTADTEAASEAEGDATREDADPSASEDVASDDAIPTQVVKLETLRDLIEERRQKRREDIRTALKHELGMA